MADLTYFHIEKRHKETDEPPSLEDLNLWAACDLARAGFSVFPTENKKPVSRESWKTTSTADVGKAYMMWTRLYPGAMPAINLEKSRHIVIDLDRHADGPDGLASWKRLCAGQDVPINIPTVETPSGGRHLVFRQPESSEPLGNREGALKGLGINVRGAGGYVVGAGAVRPEGTFYGYSGRLEALYDAPHIPAWLADMIRAGHDEEPTAQIIPLPEGERPNRRDLVALERELEELRSCPKGGRNNQLNDTAFNIAQLANDGAFAWGDVESRILEAAHACGLVRDDGLPSVRATMRSARGAAQSKPKKLKPLHSETASTKPATEHKKPQENKAPGVTGPKNSILPQIYFVRELKDKKFAPIKWLCEGVITEGCTIFGGRPKAGKSWLAFDLARGVATGTEVMGRKCVNGNVLYCALEDNQRRLQSRFQSIASDSDWDGHLQLANSWPKGDQAIQAMEQWSQTVDNPQLVIVDTLKKIKKLPKGGKESYADDYEAIEILQDFYLRTGISVLLITHTTKALADDVFDTITGTLGLTGAADNIMVLARDKSGNMSLHGKGRDMEDYAKAVSFNKGTFKWTMSGDVDEIVMSGTKKKILEFMRTVSGAVTPTEVNEATRFNIGLVKVTLKRMVAEGLIALTGRGQYLLPYTADF